MLHCMIKLYVIRRFFCLDNSELKIINHLITKVSKLDKSAIGEIFNIIGGRMFSIAFGIVKNKSLAEEVVSESLVKIVNNSHKFINFTNGYAWICKIVKNTALNVRSRENYFIKTDIEEIYDLPDLKYNNNEHMDELIIIEQALKILNEKEVLVIKLKYWEDKKIRDIAKEMNLPLTTTQELLTNAVAKMKKYINFK